MTRARIQFLFRSRPLSLFAACLCFLAVSASPSLAAVDAETALDGFDAWVEEVMKEWKVPGLGVAIVFEDEVVLAKGYGYRDLDDALPADGDTLFAIGSNSKSFTATILAMLEDEGRLEWNAPIREHLPAFRLHDSVATEQMSAVDLLSHRSGLPRHDLAWYGSPNSRAELFSMLRHLEPTAQFRERFQYQNLMFMTAGILAEELTGKTWEDLTAERIFGPLGMGRANFSVDAMQEDPNHAVPHTHSGDSEIEQIPFRNIDAIGPAGSINASAREMANYVIFHMNHGKVGPADDAERLLSEGNAVMMQTPQMVITGPLRARFAGHAEIGDPAYGLGLMTSTYHGRRHVYHGGGIDGFISAMEWLPDDRVGVVVLSNTNGSGTVPTIVARNVFDRFLGLKPVDWSARMRKQQEEGEAAAEANKQQAVDARHPDTTPSHPLEDYAGRYAHPAYGEAEVSLNEGALQVQTAAFTVPLEHYHYDVFVVPDDLQGPAAGFSGAKLLFGYNKDGVIDALEIPLEPTTGDIVFERAADDRLSDPQFLGGLTGTYELAGLQAEVSLEGDRLRLNVPGQPVYTLIPDTGTSFQIEGLNDFRIEFVLDDAGAARSFISHQPNGTFEAQRK